MLSSVALLAVLQGPVFRTSQVAVTPDEMLPLGGYTARGDKMMEPGGEDLFARALVFEDAGRSIAIVSLDALTVPESLYREVKKRIPADVHLLLVATHTHSAPDSQMLNERMTFKIPGIASFSRRWLEWYADRIGKCVADALSAPAQDGTTLRYGQCDVEANRGRREGAVPIKTASYITSGGKPILTAFAAHATVFDESRMQTSGDWPGAYSTSVGGLVLPGAIGDASPDLSTSDPVDNRRIIVEKLRAGIAKAEVKELFQKSPHLAFVEERIQIGDPVPHPDFASSFGAPEPLAQVLIERFAPREASVYLARIGEVVLIGIPGEPTSEIGRKVQVLAASLGFPHSFAVSHVNGWIGYVLGAEDYDRGGYEATLVFHGRETSAKVVEAVERGLKRLVSP